MTGAQGWLGRRDANERWVPIGDKAIMKGTFGEPYMVGLGAETFLEMTEEELRQHLRGRGMTSDESHEVKELELADESIEGKPFEVMEEMTEEDLRLLESKGKPRIAHKPMHAEAALGSVSVPDTSNALEEEMRSMRVNAKPNQGPVKDRVVERRAPTGQVSPADPSQTVLGLQVKESFFRKATALTKPVKGNPNEARLGPKESK